MILELGQEWKDGIFKLQCQVRRTLFNTALANQKAKWTEKEKQSNKQEMQENQIRVETSKDMLRQKG